MSGPKFKVKDLVHIIWMDAAVGTEGWSEETTTPAEIESVGFIVHIPTKKENYLVLCGDRALEAEDKENNRQISIPSTWIKSMRKLTL